MRPSLERPRDSKSNLSVLVRVQKCYMIARSIPILFFKWVRARQSKKVRGTASEAQSERLSPQAAGAQSRDIDR